MGTLQANSAIRITGCGKPKPGFLYQQETEHFQALTTLEDEHCGDPFPSPQFRPRSIFLCKECALRHRLIW